jgi:hypothetical protein
MGYKVFTAGEEALASDVNTLLMSQTVARFATAAARSAGLTAPVLNQLSVLDNRPGIVQYWNGSAWTDQGASELFYNEITASVNVTSTTGASAQLVAGGGAWTFDGSPVLIEFSAPFLQAGPTGGSSMAIMLWDATDLGVMGQVQSPASGSAVLMPGYMRRRITPTPGSHSYSIRAYMVTGVGGVIGAGPGGSSYPPAIMTVRRLA